MKAVLTVVGKDMVGILAKVSTVCAGKNANVLEVTQDVYKRQAIDTSQKEDRP